MYTLASFLDCFPAFNGRDADHEYDIIHRKERLRSRVLILVKTSTLRGSGQGRGAIGNSRMNSIIFGFLEVGKF